MASKEDEAFVARVRARRRAASGLPAEEKSQKHTGFLGTGIGPDIGLGATRALNEFGGGLTSLVRMALPGSKAGEPGVLDALGGIGGGLADTFIKTPVHAVEGAVDAITPGHLNAPLSRYIGESLDAATGHPGQSRDLFQDVQDRGILPALVENVGNVALAGGAISAPSKLASLGARVGEVGANAVGATEAAAKAGAMADRFAAANEALKARPLIHAMQHPYRTAGSALREGVLAPAEARVAASTTPGFVDAEAQQYARANGLPEPKPVNPGLQVNPRLGRKVADAYEAMQSNPDDPAVQASYKALADEVKQQFKFLKNKDVPGTEGVDAAGQPTPASKFSLEFADRPESGGQYADHAAMIEDVKNGRLRVDRTGPGEEHLMPAMNEVIDTDAAGNPITVNDAFRAVHDYFGHSRAENAFSRHGEEVAYQLHRQMFSPEAQAALATETRGQNSFLNFNPENVARKAAGEAAQFPDQKAGLLPERLTQPYDSAVPRTGDKILARAERRLLARDAHKTAVREQHVYDMEVRRGLQSPGVRAAVEAGRDHLMAAGMRRREASNIVGDEVRARIELGPIEQVLNEKLAAAGIEPSAIPGVARKILTETGIRQHFIPDELHTPELDAQLDTAAALYRGEKEAATQLLTEESRKGAKGLENLDAENAALTKAEARKQATANKMLDRAVGEVLERKIVRERASREGFIGAQKDKLGRIAAHLQKLGEDTPRAQAEFDHSRTWVPPAWRTPAAKAASVQDIFDRTEQGLGVTFNPHTGEYLEPGRSVGNSVGLVNGTALKVAATPADAAKWAARTGEQLEVFEPRHIEQVINQYQDVFGASSNTTIGTWRDDFGVIHIDPAEVVDNLDEALIRAASRGQEAIYDFPGRSVVDVPLQMRPDIAAHFVDRNTHYLKTAAQARKLVSETAVTSDDVDKIMALNARMAVSAMDNGLVSHPDDFFKEIHGGYQLARRGSRVEGVLRQAAENLGLNKDLSTPEARQALWKDIQASGIDIDKAAHWYRDSHAWVEKVFRDKGDITLLDGSKRNAADLLYQLIAVTSVNNNPALNLRDALTGLSYLNKEGGRLRNAWGGLLSKVADGKMTMEGALDEMFGSSTEEHPASGAEGRKNTRSGTSKNPVTKAPGLPEHPLFTEITGGVHHAGIAKEMVAEILAGNTMDKWTPEYLADRTLKLWGREEKKFQIPGENGKLKTVPFEDARRWIEENRPDDVAELGADRAVVEFFGSDVNAKIMSFYDNLANPETSKAVTLDRWMKGLFGSQISKPGEWLDFSNQVRDMAKELDLPAGEMQAVLWVYAFKMAGKDPNLAASFGELVTNPDFHTTKAGTPSAVAKMLDTHADVLDADRFFQKFHSTVMGEFVPLNDTAKGVIRVFENGNFGTLVHENGHLLRRLLTPAQMSAVEGALGVTDGQWTVPHEEAFADHLMGYMNGGAAPKGLESTFARIKQQIATVWEHVRSTFQKDRVPEALVDTFNEWLDPAVRNVEDITPAGPQGIVGLASPAEETGTLAQRGARAPKFDQPPATGSDLYRAGRQGAKAEARIEKLAARQRDLERSKQSVEKSIADMTAVLNGHRTPSEIEKAGLVDQASKLLGQVAESSDDPSLVRTPAKWQPLMHGFRELAEYGKQNPELAQALEDVPTHLSDVIRVATENGFDPGHVRHFTPRQVKRLLSGGLRLGLQETEAGTRKARRYTVNGVDRSLESLGAAIAEVHQEIRTNAVIDWVENTVARPVAKDQTLPPGYELWSGTKTFLQTGQEISDGVLRETAGAEGKMIPTAVAKEIRRFSKDYDHWAPQMLAKITNPWRALVLTLSPGWYVRNIAGNAMMAVAEGVSLRDWVAAWDDHKTHGEGSTLSRLRGSGLGQDLATGEPQLLPPGFRAARQEKGAVLGTISETARLMQRVNEGVDEFARSAVYHHGLRKNMTTEQAWIRAQEALVDYGGMSGFERSIVRSVVPFYSWQKGILKVTLGQALDHPGRTAMIMQLGKMNDEYIADRFGLTPADVPEAYKHLVGSKNIRSFNPFADAAQILSPEGIAQSINPFLEIAVRKGLGAPEFFSDDKRLGPFGSQQGDVNVAGELGNLLTGVPGARALGFGNTQGQGAGDRVNRFIGVPASVNDDQLQERLLKARQAITGEATGFPKGWDSTKHTLSPARKAAVLKRIREQWQRQQG